MPAPRCTPRLGPGAAAAAGLLALLAGSVASGTALGGCGTVDLGDNIVPPDLRLDEDFFYCEIQPNVLTAKSCAGGGSGEGGMCHDSRSALVLVEPMGGPPECADGVVTGGTIPTDYMANFEAIRFTVQSDPLSSPLYRRPTGMDSHPRMIFPETDPCADLIVEWINRGAF